MNTKINFTKTDILVFAVCVLFLMANLGAVGSAGRQKAMETVCLSNLDRWGNAFNMWLSDHDGAFMNGKEKWFYTLGPYYGAQNRDREIRREYKIRFCPTAMGFDDEGATQPFVAWHWIGAQGGTEAWMQYYWDTSYGSNSYIYSPPPNSIGSAGYANYWKTANVKNTSQIPVLLDSESFGGRPTETDPPPPDASQTPDEVVRASEASFFMWQFCIDRHNGSTNALFMDFSARPVGLKELWTLRWSRSFNTAGPWTIAGNHGNPIQWPDWMKKYKDY